MKIVKFSNVLVNLALSVQLVVTSLLDLFQVE